MFLRELIKKILVSMILDGKITFSDSRKHVRENPYIHLKYIISTFIVPKIIVPVMVEETQASM